MAQVEIYKLRNSVHPSIREASVFDFMEKGANPDPAHYVKEWAGQMHGTLPLTIPGRLMLDTPEGYQGGELKNGDIAVVEGRPYYLDRSSGYKFVELNSFDADSARQARHFQYGWSVDIKGAEAISDDLAYICDDIGVPCGYLGEQSAGGIYNERRPFLPGTSDEYHLIFLHPHFLTGDEARAFIELLTELSEAEKWAHISAYLHEITPLTIQDLQDAREMFAPELLVPAELRPLAEVIPADADKTEIDYLTTKVKGMSEDQRNIFNAVVEAGWHCGSVTELINLTENLECFDLEPAFSESQYGEFRLENDFETCETAIERLKKSEDISDRFLAKYITLLSRCADNENYGYHAAKEDGGVFTHYGYIYQGRGLEEKYRGVQDIPAEFHVAVTTPDVEAAENSEPLIMLGNGDLSVLLLEMHVLGGYSMTEAKRNLQTLAGGGNEFFVMINDHTLTVTPAEPIYHKGTSEHDTWMAMEKTPDTRAFVMSVTERENDRILGCLSETDFAAIKSSINFNSINSNDPASVGQLAAFLDVMRWAVQENRRAVPEEIFLRKINEPYMARSHSPRHSDFRVSPDAARELLAQDALFVFKSYPEPVARLMPIDAAKSSLWTADRFEFFVRSDQMERLKKWARRSAGEILHLQERGGCDKAAPDKAKPGGKEL